MIYLSGNSPGELWGWVRPFVSALRKRFPQNRLSLFLLPCNYATGKEVEIARDVLGIETVYSPKESLKMILLGHSFNRGHFAEATGMSSHLRNPTRRKICDLSGELASEPSRRRGENEQVGRHPRSDLQNDKDRVLVHLGGDIMYAYLLAKRLKAQAYIYQWGNKWWDRGIHGYFVTHAEQKSLLIRRGIPATKIKVAGNLIKDAIQLELDESPGKQFTKRAKYLVAFFPGSRMVEMKHLLPFYLRVAELVKTKFHDDVEFALAVSPFMDHQTLANFVSPRAEYTLESTDGSFVKIDNEEFIRTKNGALIRLNYDNQYPLMQMSDCIVTIPGTKCGEAGILGSPMLVVLPTNQLEEIPYPGIPGLLEKIPLLGRKLKRLLLSAVLSKLGFVAQPNILAQKAIVPEMVSDLTPLMVSEALCRLLLDEPKRKEMRQELLSLYQTIEPAADNMIDAIEEDSH